MKETKAVFLYDWYSKIDLKVIYERVKEFFLNDFQEIECCKHATILHQGKMSNDLMIIKEGSFILTKTINLADPL